MSSVQNRESKSVTYILFECATRTNNMNKKVEKSFFTYPKDVVHERIH